MTYRELCLLADVKSQLRNVTSKKTFYDHDRLIGLEEHLKNLGVEV